MKIDVVVAESVIDHVRDSVIARIDSANATTGSALAATSTATDDDSIVVPLCRDDAQLDAVLDAGAKEVELGWMELVGLARAVERARARGARVTVATVRVQKPGEDKIDAHLARLEPDAVLVRSWGSLQVVAYFKYQSTKAMNTLSNTGTITKFWQRNYYEHIIRNEADHHRIHLYIESNIDNWVHDEENPVNVE